MNESSCIILEFILQYYCIFTEAKLLIQKNPHPNNKLFILKAEVGPIGFTAFTKQFVYFWKN